MNLDVYVWNEGGFGLFDVGRTFTQVRLDSWPEGRYGGSFACASAALVRDGTTFRAKVIVGTTEAVQICEHTQNLPFGVLPAGTYRVEVDFVRPDATLIESHMQDFEVKLRDVVCNVSPDNHLLDLLFSARDPAGFVNRFQDDAGFRASLAGISIAAPRAFDGFWVISAEFPPLVDPQRVLATLRSSSEFDLVRYYAPEGCGFDICPGNLVREAVEFIHAANDQYFFSDDPAEIDALDRGAPHLGWSRTGETFRVIHHYGQAYPIEGRVQKVYRFWNSSATGKASHFFSIDQRECAVLRDHATWAWTFEGTPFWAFASGGGACSDGTPLYRVYNNGQGGAPAHRYTTRPAIVGQMVAKGWVSEGVVMCVAAP